MRAWLIAAVVVWVCAVAPGQPVSVPVVTPGATNERHVASSGVGGLWAVSDGVSVEVLDARGGGVRGLVLADFAAVVAGLDVETARVGQIALSESGRLLFVTLQRPARTDTLTSRTDEIVRVEVESGSMSRFATIPLNGVGSASAQSFPLVHADGRLFVGGPNSVIIYAAGRNDLTGTVTQGYVGMTPGVSGLAFDRVGSFLFILVRDGRVVRVNIGTGTAATMTSGLTEGVGLAFCDHHGARVTGSGSVDGGLFVAMADGRVRLLPTLLARGIGGTPQEYVPASGPAFAMTRLAAGFDGGLLVARQSQVERVSDASDTRLGFDAWMADELAQQVLFAKSLISPTGEPPGWVIDGNVTPGGTLFHPATPDAAAWAVLLLLAGDDVLNDAQARPLVRTILQRYAGHLPGPAPSRTADGVFRHWIDPSTGGVKPGWDPEFALMSTMKLVHAAARAGNVLADDPQIVAAARAICCGVRNHDAYLNTATRAMYLKGLAGGGPDTGSGLVPFHEGLLFAEQAGFYGGAGSRTVRDAWYDRGLWPFALYIAGRPITSNYTGFQPAFVSVYPVLLLERFREEAGWQSHVSNLSAASAGWTDDNRPRWFTVFSAGTAKPEWGGYHADTLGDNPGRVTTFPALIGLAARADGRGVREAGGAYHAYRVGARQTFRGGASILYRRSTLDPAWSPPDGGLPDIAMGGLGLAELLRPGFVDRVLLGGLPVCGACRADVGRTGGLYGPDGLLNNNDFVVFIDAFFSGNLLVADTGSTGGAALGDGVLDNNDFVVFIDRFFGGCP